MSINLVKNYAQRLLNDWNAFHTLQIDETKVHSIYKYKSRSNSSTVLFQDTCGKMRVGIVQCFLRKVDSFQWKVIISAYSTTLDGTYCLRTIDAILDVCVVIQSISYTIVPLGAPPSSAISADFYKGAMLSRQWIFPIHSDNFIIPTTNTWRSHSGYKCSFHITIFNDDAMHIRFFLLILVCIRFVNHVLG